MTQIDLDKGILERLMSDEVALLEQPHKPIDTHLVVNEVNGNKEGDVAAAAAAAAANRSTNADVTMPIVQVINIQNIATSAFLLKYKNSEKSNIKSENEDDADQDEENNKSTDRYLLILSDGEYYETRCLLLPNLNYMVGTKFEFRTGHLLSPLNIRSNDFWTNFSQLSVKTSILFKETKFLNG